MLAFPLPPTHTHTHTLSLSRPLDLSTSRPLSRPLDLSPSFFRSQNGGGQILFREFCDYIADFLDLQLEAVDAKWVDHRKTNKKGKKAGSKAGKKASGTTPKKKTKKAYTDFGELGCLLPLARPPFLLPCPWFLQAPPPHTHTHKHKIRNRSVELTNAVYSAPRANAPPSHSQCAYARLEQMWML